MKQTIYVYWKPDKYSAEGGNYGCHNMAGFETAFPGEYILIGQQEVEFNIDPFDARSLLIDSLKTEKDKIISEATKNAQHLEEKIQQLLALDAPA